MSIMQLACFARFSAGLALFTGRNERRHAHHDHLRFYGMTIMSTPKNALIAARTFDS
jgi:hypothetical protein